MGKLQIPVIVPRRRGTPYQRLFRYFALSFMLCSLIAYFWISGFGDERRPAVVPQRWKLDNIHRKETLERLIRKIYGPLILPITATSFRDRAGEVYRLHTNPPLWTEPLGKDLCILDMDTRPLDGPNEAFSASHIDWASMKGVSPGIFNHYMYAMIHGYSYKFIRTTPPAGRSAPWAELSGIASALEDCKVVASLDADAIFQNLELPLEWLLNRWNITRDIALAMPLDPVQTWMNPSSWRFHNYDRRGRLQTNPGFIIAQDLPVTRDILSAWMACPDEVKGCEKFAYAYPAEMGAFAEYVRYEYPDAVREYPCTEGNGFPEQKSECKGVFVRHFTTDKSLLKGGVADVLLQSLIDLLHVDLISNHATEP